jgi:hypothetical protein
MQAGNYNDFQLTYVQMGSDMIEDTWVKTGGGRPDMGTGLDQRGHEERGNTFNGSIGYAHQALGWNDDNTSATTRFDLPPSSRRLPGTNFQSTGEPRPRMAWKQLDGSFGGPVMRDKVCPSARSVTRRSKFRSHDQNVSDITSYYPGFEQFDQLIEGYQPYVKVTASLNPSHDLRSVFQRDRTQGESSWEYFTDPSTCMGTAGTSTPGG